MKKTLLTVCIIGGMLSDIQTVFAQSSTTDCAIFKELWAGTTQRFVNVKDKVATSDFDFPTFGKPQYTEPDNFSDMRTLELWLYRSSRANAEAEATALYEKVKAELKKCKCNGGTWYEGTTSESTDPDRNRLKASGYKAKTKAVKPRSIEVGLATNSLDALAGKKKQYYVILYLSSE